ncbi:hypothetical protein AK812_SmicGene7648 [Symbiodinium microadriaticum]|uniref:Glycoside hydrolase family 5 domain-containing protein n=1 Tax=Symbiodinium microadriaticum TaxID=2951 RepID=A0A1Q9EMZ4_SYMMI|nr:hypothetical protein AK812_SmicGene7648 [Symbiodinium microadriaticum]
MAAVAQAPRSRFREMAHGNRSPTSSVTSLFSGTTSLTRTELRRDQREHDLDHIMAELLQEHPHLASSVSMETSGIWFLGGRRVHRIRTESPWKRVLVDNVRRPLGDLLEEVLKEHQLEMQMEAQAQRSRRLLQSHFQRKERNENLQLLRAGLQAFEGAASRSRAAADMERSPTPSHVQAGMWQAMWCRTYVLLAVVVRAAQGTDLGPNWAGVNSFFAHALPSSGPYSRTAYLDKIRDAGLRVLRIFISQTEADYKNSGSQAVDDIETKKVGTYDDRILSMVDDLMLEAYERGIKLDIALHDRYSLGCWRTDAYVTTYHLPSGCCNCTVSKNQVDRFYSEPQIQVAFDKRLRHILQHRNPHFNAPWGQLHEVVASFAPENEAQGHDWLVDKGWWCRRAQVMKNCPHERSTLLLLLLLLIIIIMTIIIIIVIITITSIIIIIIITIINNIIITIIVFTIVTIITFITIITIITIITTITTITTITIITIITIMIIIISSFSSIIRFTFIVVTIIIIIIIIIITIIIIIMIIIIIIIIIIIVTIIIVMIMIIIIINNIIIIIIISFSIITIITTITIIITIIIISSIEHMHPDIPISTGGSIGLLDALYQQLYMCPEIDVVDIHTYTDDDLWLRDVAQVSVTWALTQNKRVRLQEFGSQGNDESKAKTIFSLIYAASEIGIPFMPWQLVHPESTTDYEFWTDGELWRGLSAQSQMAQDNVTVFLWPELNLSNSSMQLKADWRLCVVNSECTSGCCSNEFSGDRKYKCTPGGSQCTGHLLADWVWCTQSSECACGCCSSEYSDDGRYKCTPGGTPRFCGEALARNGQPCFENGNCRSGCCSSGAASAATCAAGSVGATALAFGILSLMPISCNWKIRQGKSMPAAWRSASNEC